MDLLFHPLDLLLTRDLSYDTIFEQTPEKLCSSWKFSSLAGKFRIPTERYIHGDSLVGGAVDLSKHVRVGLGDAGVDFEKPDLVLFTVLVVFDIEG
jgi:hypothetical protein